MSLGSTKEGKKHDISAQATTHSLIRIELFRNIKGFIFLLVCIGTSTNDPPHLVATCTFNEKLVKELFLNVDILFLQKAWIIDWQSCFFSSSMVASFRYTFSSLPLVCLWILVGKLVQKRRQGKVPQRIAGILNVASCKPADRRMIMVPN
jgi:hypothetical protein